MPNYQNYYPNYYNSQNANNIQEMQNLRDRLDRQISQAQIAQTQTYQPFSPQTTPQIQQTFQLNNPQQNSTDFDAKYANNIDEVKNSLVLKSTLFITKDITTMWLKDVSGNIKTYSLTEVIEKDEKDKKIDELTKQIENMTEIIATQLSKVPTSDQQPLVQVAEKNLQKNKEDSKSIKK